MHERGGSEVALETTMTWFFSRGDERLEWEVRQRGAQYELCLHRPDGTSTVQRAATPRELLDHVHRIPRALFVEGWRPVYRC